MEIGEADGERFWITDRERTVVDALRMRHVVGESEAHGALRRYLRQPHSQRVALVEMARQLRVWGPLSVALSVLGE